MRRERYDCAAHVPARRFQGLLRSEDRDHQGNRELHTDRSRRRGKGRYPYTVARKVSQEEIQALYDTLELLSEKKLETVVDLAEKARRILIVGVGRSSIMAQAFCALRRRLDYPAAAPTDIHLQLAEASLLTEKDLCVVISYSGRTRDPIEVMRTARSQGARIVCVTGNERSPAALVSDLVLVSISHERTPDPVSSRVSQMAIFHSLCAAFALRQTFLCPPKECAGSSPVRSNRNLLFAKESISASSRPASLVPRPADFVP